MCTRQSKKKFKSDTPIRIRVGQTRNFSRRACKKLEDYFIALDVCRISFSYFTTTTLSRLSLAFHLSGEKMSSAREKRMNALAALKAKREGGTGAGVGSYKVSSGKREEEQGNDRGY